MHVFLRLQSLGKMMQEHPIWRSWWKLEAANTSTLRDPLPRNAIQSAHICFKYRYIYYMNKKYDRFITKLKRREYTSFRYDESSRMKTQHHSGPTRPTIFKSKSVVFAPWRTNWRRPKSPCREVHRWSRAKKAAELNQKRRRQEASQRLVLLKRPFGWGIENDIRCIVNCQYVLEDQPPNKNNLMLSKWVWTGMLTVGNGKWVLKPFGLVWAIFLQSGLNL